MFVKKIKLLQIFTPYMNKICSKCKEGKTLENFRNQAKGKYGKKNYCILCDDQNSKEVYQRNKELRLLQVEEWNNKNPSKLSSYQKKYRNKKLET